MPMKEFPWVKGPQENSGEALKVGEWKEDFESQSVSCVIKVGAQSVGKMISSLDPIVRPCPLQSSVALGRCSRREAKSPKPEVMSPAVDPREPAVTFTRKLEPFLAAVGLQKLLL